MTGLSAATSTPPESLPIAHDDSLTVYSNSLLGRHRPVVVQLYFYSHHTRDGFCATTNRRGGYVISCMTV